MFEPGMHVADLVVREELSGGRACRLFLAERRGPLGFHRRLLLKVCRADGATDPGAEARLLGEAAHASVVDHPNVRQVERVGAHRGRPFLVLEHVDGCSLGQLLDYLRGTRRRLRPELAVHIAVRLASALQAIHEARPGRPERLHRALCPDHVMLTRSGHVKLIGHGPPPTPPRSEAPPARALPESARVPPEARAGHEVDRRADLYALGACLWEMLTLRAPPCEGDRAGQGGALPPPSRWSGALPGALDRAVLRALAPYPEDRPPTARALRHALAGAVPGALLVEEAELARLVAEARTLGSHRGAGDTTFDPGAPTAVLQPGRLRALRRRSRVGAERWPSRAGRARALRGVAVAAVLLAVGIGATLGRALATRPPAAADAGGSPPLPARAKVSAAPSQRTTSASAAVPAEEAPPTSAVLRESSPAEVRLGPPAPAVRARSPTDGPRARGGSGRARGAGARVRTRGPIGAEKPAPAEADDWPVVVLDELGAWEPRTRLPPEQVTRGRSP